MSQNYEDIQAQLAAYIDGAMPPEQRAEIEKHLAANPSHQALLGELAVHKRIIGGLPRVKAPADLTEELLTQLEREQLLSGPVLDEPRPVIFRLFGGVGLAAAASVLLMLGLVVAIYHVLPGRPPVAIVSPSPSPAPLPALDDTMLRKTNSLSEHVFEAHESLGKNSLERRALPPAPSAMKGISKDAIEQERNLEFDKPALTPSAQNVEQVTLAIAASNVDQANSEVLRFLTDNDIAWSVGADNDVLSARNFNYPRAAALTESARIKQYSLAIAEELHHTNQADIRSTGGGAFGGGGGAGAGVAARGGLAGGPGASKAPAPTNDAVASQALAGAAGQDDARQLRSFGARPAGDGAVDAKLLQEKRKDNGDRIGPLDGYTNLFAEANNRTILARGLKASQIEQLASVLEKPVDGQALVLYRETSDKAAVSALRARSQRYALADRSDFARRAASMPAKMSEDKVRGMSEVDGVRTKQDKQEVTGALPLQLMVKPGIAKSAAPTSQTSLVQETGETESVDRLQQQQRGQMAVRDEGVLADQPAAPTTRPADTDLYDVLIVLSPAPVVAPVVNAPPAAASPVPATAPASQPIPDAKRE